MDKKKIIELVILGILIILLIVMVMSSFKPKKGKVMSSPKPGKEKAKLIPSPKQPPSPKTDISKLLQEQKKREEQDWGTDPFYHTVKRKVTQRNLVLKGITVGKGRKNYAFINDQIVTVGDTVSGYKVIEVEKNRVLLRKGEESFYLALSEE